MRNILIVAPLVVALLVAFNTFFTLDETEQGIIIQFGKYVRSVDEPGLDLKIPFIQDLIRYEKRLLRYDAPPAEYLTRDKKALVVDSYARFRISDPLCLCRHPAAHVGPGLWVW